MADHIAERLADRDAAIALVTEIWGTAMSNADGELGGPTIIANAFIAHGWAPPATVGFEHASSCDDWHHNHDDCWCECHSVPASRDSGQA